MILNSNKRSYLLISDAHQDIDRLNKIISRENCDAVVFLGDFWDSYHYDDRLDWIKTTEFIKEWHNKENFYWLIANHDAHYLFPNANLRCSGWNKEKQLLINDRFKDIIGAVRQKMTHHLIIDNYLFTHAGLHPSFIPPFLDIADLEKLDSWLDTEHQKSVEACMLSLGDLSWMDEAGKDRGGRAKNGGLIWLDWNNFEPIEGLNQAMGHTFQRDMKISSKEGINSCNFCIDTNMNQYMILANGKLSILQDKI